MRVSVVATAVVSLFFAGQFLLVSSCCGQTATPGNPPKLAPVQQVSTPPVFTSDQRGKIREIVKEELVPVKEKIDPWIYLTRTMLWVVGIIAAALISIAGIALRQSVGGLKKKAELRIKEIDKLLQQAHRIVDQLQTIRDKAKEQAEVYSTQMKITGKQTLADLGKTFTHRTRYVVTQGGSTVEPSWEFDLVLLFNTKGNSSVNGLLRTSGGAAFNSLKEEEKKEWQECTITLHEDKSITLERLLTGTCVGKTQNFKGKPGPAQKIIRDNTAMVWEGAWFGFGADNADGAFIIYLD